MHQLGDFRHQIGLVDHVGNLGHDDALPVLLHVLDVRLRAHDDAAAAGVVRVVNAPAPQNHAAGWEVRALDEVHQLVDLALGLIQHVHARVDHLA